jgi:hypothetical protein
MIRWNGETIRVPPMSTCKNFDDSIRPCIHYIAGGMCKLSQNFICIEYARRHGIPIANGKASVEEPKHISYSQLVTWTACKKKWALSREYELIEKPIRMMMGNIASRCFDAVHTGQDWKPIITSYIEGLDVHDEEDNYKLQELTGLYSILEYYSKSAYGEMHGLAQKEANLNLGNGWYLTGRLDLYIDTIGYEFKYTGRPDGYSKWILEDQLSTYFLLVPDLQRITVRLITVPSLKLGRKKSIQEYAERIKIDVTRRPGHYIRDVNYWRNEFDLANHLDRIKRITEEIDAERLFYPTSNRTACFMPGPCEFLPVCESGAISEELYKKREIKNGKQGTND